MLYNIFFGLGVLTLSLVRSSILHTAIVLYCLYTHCNPIRHYVEQQVKAMTARAEAMTDREADSAICQRLRF